jgi:hypothetical protein
MIKLQVEEQNNNTGLWNIVKEFQQIYIEKEIPAVSIFGYRYFKIKYELGPSESNLRIDAHTFAKTLSNKVRIVYCDSATDDYGLNWYPDNWKKVIWQNGEWL